MTSTLRSTRRMRPRGVERTTSSSRNATPRRTRSVTIRIGIVDVDDMTIPSRLDRDHALAWRRVAASGRRHEQPLRARESRAPFLHGARGRRTRTTTRDAISSASESCWVVRSTAPPSAANETTSAKSDRRAVASIPAVGSSRKRASGLPASAQRDGEPATLSAGQSPRHRDRPWSRGRSARAVPPSAWARESARERGRRSPGLEGPAGTRSPAAPRRSVGALLGCVDRDRRAWRGPCRDDAARARCRLPSTCRPRSARGSARISPRRSSRSSPDNARLSPKDFETPSSRATTGGWAIELGVGIQRDRAGGFPDATRLAPARPVSEMDSDASASIAVPTRTL